MVRAGFQGVSSHMRLSCAPVRSTTSLQTKGKSNEAVHQYCIGRGLSIKHRRLIPQPQLQLLFRLKSGYVRPQDKKFSEGFHSVLLSFRVAIVSMLRRQARERRDYLYRRALQLRDASIAEKRALLKRSLATGKPLDPSLANDKSLRKDFKYDESQDNETAEAQRSLDDEYSMLSGLTDPRPLVTTSRSPSTRLAGFSKEIRLLLPTAIRLNRGNLILPNLLSSAKAAALSDIILLHEHRGTPTAMTISHLPHGPTASFSLHNVVLRADIPNASRGTVSESYPHLIFEGFSTPLGRRVVQILKHIFPPRDGAHKVGNRVVTFKNVDDSVEVRHHVFVQTSYREVELAEVGPRMTMRCFEIRGGTLEKESGGEVEWALTQYTRTGRKKNYM
jgi:U3 small nucleolar ribonucleoprotein protein IMP4